MMLGVPIYSLSLLGFKKHPLEGAGMYKERERERDIYIYMGGASIYIYIIDIYIYIQNISESLAYNICIVCKDSLLSSTILRVAPSISTSFSVAECHSEH